MHVDVVIIGGGIAGLSCAAYLSPRASVALVEAESSLGYHATGRSAAIYTECYGAELIRRLSLASRTYFVDREEPLGSVHAVLFVAAADNAGAVDDLYNMYLPLVPTLQRLSPDEVTALVPVIHPDKTAGGILEPGALNLDVHGILTSFATTARTHGCNILTASRVTRITRDGRAWRVLAGDHTITATTIVDAAGPWGDVVATMAGVAPLGLTPLKRSAFTFDPGMSTSDWPFVVDAGEQWYMKPEGPHLLGSAASEIPEAPSDARPDELDVALGIERINESTALSVRSIKNQWAGLRTFTSDRIPAAGYDDDGDGFFWLVGQGGYGIHTSPALGATAAGLLLDGVVPESVARYGVTAEMLHPGRLR
ncbi:MAG: FAD-dependent oxidoreductase [Actinobacteria bacterium]|nr:MAG: FAD-dependent oxidoreductase [Actinomycetota bacterium]